MNITLATLATATAQQVFDQAARHLLAQNKKSMASAAGPLSDSPFPICAYRSPQGLKCAAGCFISDEELNNLIAPQRLNNSPWSALVDHGIAPTQHSRLIENLQRIHDSQSPRYWASDLRELAKHLALDSHVIQEV